MLKHYLCAGVVFLCLGGQTTLVNADNLPNLNNELDLTLPKINYTLNGEQGSLSAQMEFIGPDEQGNLLWKLTDYKVDNNAEPLSVGCDGGTLVAGGETKTLDDRVDGVDYLINCQSRVNGDLTIAPGVTIQFATDSGLEVTGGSIEAVGSAEQPIIFTGEDKIAGSWAGIMIESNDIKNRLEYIEIEYGGGSAFNSNGDLGSIIVWADSRLTLRNSTIRNSEAWGLNAPYGGSELKLTNNVFTGNDAPLQLEPPYASMVSGGDYTGNSIDEIFIISGDTIHDTERWDNLDVPYRINGHVRVTSGELTIEPGTTLRFENGSKIEMGDSDKSSFIAVGTPEEPITFTAVNPLPGAWEGLIFHSTNSPLNEIGHAVIEYAGTNEEPGAIYMWSAPVLNVHDVTFRGIEHCAFYVAPSSSSPNNNLTLASITYETTNQEVCNE